MGRADLIETLSGQLTAASVAATLVALVGMGGLGKTSLAAALAHYLRDHVADGVLWVNVTTSDPMNTLALWARAYGYDFSGLTDVESRGTAVRSILADKQALIVLDNVESSAAAKPLLLGGPDCAVVITTRNLDSAAALDAHPVLLAELSPESSRDLLVHILGEERVLATADEAAAAAQIGHLLHHLPLAVGIAAQRLKSRPRMRLSGMARRLQDTQQRLGLEISDSAVRSSFRVSWDGLDTPLRHLFSCMAVFAARSFTPQAIATTADRDLLDIEQSDYNTAWERLEQALPLLYQLENGSGIAKTKYFQGYVLYDQGEFAKAEQVLEEARKLQNELGDVAEEAKATRMLARVYFEIDRTVDRAENTAQHAIQLQTEIENIADMLTTYRLLANIEIRKENLELATMYLNKAIDFSDMLNNLFEKGAAFFLLIVVYSLQEKYEHAEKLAHESLTLFRRLGNRRYESMTLHEMSLNHLALGNYDQAKDITNQTLEIYQAIGDRLGYGYALRHLGNIYKALGQSEKAQQALGEAKQIAGFLGHRHLMNLVTQSLNNLN